MFTIDASELLYLVLLTAMRFGLPVMLVVLMTALARRVQTLQP